jgi:hypothetical protein
MGSLRYPVAGSDGCGRVSRDPQASGHVLSISRQCVFTAPSVPFRVLFQRVAVRPATCQCCASKAVYSQCAGCHLVTVYSMWSPLGNRNGRGRRQIGHWTTKSEKPHASRL